ncbi:hypothetical protein SAMN06298216_4369 [Spirosomataceae bacterium TFI 002]|nr:hypothetical protein SAMN06298216_4369 [Spirosomataceae bacterium TFI 002]
MKKEKKSETIVFRTTLEQKENIGILASENGVSTSKWIFEALRRTINEENKPTTIATNEKESNPLILVFLMVIGTWLIFRFIRTSHSM